MKKEISIEKVKDGFLIKVGQHKKIFNDWHIVISYLTGYFGILPIRQKNK